jgi:hypothetical protein
MRTRLGLLAFGLASLAVAPIAVAAWPIGPYEVRVYGPATYTDPQNGGVNTMCANSCSTSFGSVWVAQTKTLVNFGETCNAAWDRPANRFDVRAVARNSSGGWVNNSGLIPNGANTSLVQATVAQGPVGGPTSRAG